MRLRTDDDLYDVDARWYGPPGKTLPFKVRYKAYALGAGVYVLLTVLARGVLHAGMSLALILELLMATALITTRVMKSVNPDRSVAQLLASWGDDLRAPRPTKKKKKPKTIAARYSCGRVLNGATHR
jgi:hypothetical protein